MDEYHICREIISLIYSSKITSSDLQKIKNRICKKYGLSDLPKNSAILAAAKSDEYEYLRRLLLVKPGRTLSGVAPIAVMTSPYPCPHGKCLPCPGGPDHPFGSPQSYTGEEPAALRGRQHEFDPYAQTRARLTQFTELGHRVDKAELIVMGGTITARTPEFQEEFVSECIRAMNEFGIEGNSLGKAGIIDRVSKTNESAYVRCIAITFETRPDYCGETEINRMLELGVTKVEIGVQHLDDEILKFNERGCGVNDTVRANTLLRDAGLKVGFHMMPNLPASSIEKDRWMFEELWKDSRFRPDFLKIYPTLVTEGSGIEKLWREGKYQIYDEEELIELVAYAKSLLPDYVRLQRMQRDIPARLILAGSRHSNFRQLAKKRLIEGGGECRCIRCREVGRAPINGEQPTISVIEYECCGGTEFFIQAGTNSSLVGFSRLRFPSSIFREELDGAALMRELHVYGLAVAIGEEAEGGEWQHRNYGKQLLERAEEISASAGYNKLAVMSGIGVRPYYHRLGYERTGPYMIKKLDRM